MLFSTGKIYRTAGIAAMVATAFASATAQAELRREDLSPAELAVVDTFLTRRPQYQHTDTPQTLSQTGKGEHDWPAGLTRESFERIATVYPELRERVTFGREFRIDYLNGVEARVNEFLTENQKLEVSPAQRLAASYDAFLRAANLRNERKVDPNFVRGQVYEQIRGSRGYAVGSSVDSWDVEAQRRYQAVLEFRLAEKEKTQPLKELPKDLFERWRKLELQRLQSILDAHDGTPEGRFGAIDSDGKRMSAQKLAAHLGNDERYSATIYDRMRRSRLLQARATAALLASANGADQTGLLGKLESRATREKKVAEEDRHELFGGTDHVGGKVTPLARPELGFLQDLDWWGVGQQVVAGEKKDPHWDYWTERAKRSGGWWPFRKPVLEQLLKAEEYAAKRKAAYDQRVGFVRKWGKRVGAVAAVAAMAFGAYQWGRDGITAARDVWQSATTRLAPATAPAAGTHSAGDRANPSTTAGSGTVATAPAKPRGDPWAEALEKERQDLPAATDPKPVETSEAPGFRVGNFPSVIVEGGDDNRLSKNIPLPEGEQGSGGRSNADANGLYRFIPGAGRTLESIPTQFELASKTGSLVTLPDTLPVGAKVAFTIETGAPRLSRGNTLSLLAAQGYTPVVDVWRGGQRLVPGKEFVVEQKADGTAEIRFLGAYAVKPVTFSARYYETPNAPWGFTTNGAKLPPLDLNEVAWLSALFREEGHRPVSDALDQALADALAKDKPIRAEEVIRIISEQTFYTERAGEETAPVVRENFVSGFRKYPITDGHMCLQCTGGASVGSKSLRTGWSSQSVEVGERAMIARLPNESVVVFGHQRVYAKGSDGKLVVFDPTPTKKDPNQPAKKIDGPSKPADDFERAQRRSIAANPDEAKHRLQPEKPREEKASVESAAKELEKAAPRPDGVPVQPLPAAPAVYGQTGEQPDSAPATPKPVPLSPFAELMFQWMDQVFDHRYRNRNNPGVEQETEAEREKRLARRLEIYAAYLAKQAATHGEPGQEAKKEPAVETAPVTDVVAPVEAAVATVPKVSAEAPKSEPAKAAAAPVVLPPVVVPPPALAPKPVLADTPEDTEAKAIVAARVRENHEAARVALEQLRASNLALAQSELQQVIQKNLAAAQVALDKRIAENLAAAKKESEKRQMQNRAAAEKESRARRARNEAREKLEQEIVALEKFVANRAEALRLSNKSLTDPHRQANGLAGVLRQFLTSPGWTPARLGEALEKIGLGDGKPATGASIASALREVRASIEKRVKASAELGKKFKDGDPAKDYVDARMLKSIDNLLALLEGASFSAHENDKYEEVLAEFQKQNPDDLPTVLDEIRAKNPEKIELLLAIERKKNPEDLQKILAEVRRRHPEDFQVLLARERAKNPEDLASVRRELAARAPGGARVADCGKTIGQL